MLVIGPLGIKNIGFEASNAGLTKAYCVPGGVDVDGCWLVDCVKQSVTGTDIAVGIISSSDDPSDSTTGGGLSTAAEVDCPSPVAAILADLRPVSTASTRLFFGAGAFPFNGCLPRPLYNTSIIV